MTAITAASVGVKNPPTMPNSTSPIIAIAQTASLKLSQTSHQPFQASRGWLSRTARR